SSNTAATSATATPDRARRSPAQSSRRIRCPMRRFRASCAAPIAPCRPIRKLSCRRRNCGTSTPICSRSRPPRTGRPYRCWATNKQPQKNDNRRTIEDGAIRPLCFLSSSVGWVSLRSTHPTAHSHIQHQPVGLAAGAADHHALVLGLLLLGEDRVAVLGNAGDDALLAGT